MLVKNILPTARKRLAVIGDEAPVIEAAGCLGKPHTNLVVVCNTAGAMVGVITKTDVVKHISHCHGHACTIAVAELMIRDVVSCGAEDWLHEVWSVMRERAHQCVPIVDSDTKPLGILYARDALQALLTEVEDEEALLLDYIMSVGFH